jgi:small subunit ribosomal protein S6
MFAAISAYLLHGLSHLFLDFRRDLHMPLYESTLIARPDISGQQVEGLSEQFQEIVREKGGEVAKTEYWGLRSLTYKIKKNRKGHYLFMQIDAPAEAIAEMERNMRINEDVMRYLTIRIDALDPEPSVVMQSRGSRDSRGRGEYRSRDGERGEGRRDGPRDAPRADAPKDDGKAAAASATGAASVENSDSNAQSGAE